MSVTFLRYPGWTGQQVVQQTLRETTTAQPIFLLVQLHPRDDRCDMSIVLNKLTKRYEGHPVVNDVSLEVTDGEFFVLLGSSGSGKTTVLSMIAGLTGIDQGNILLHGRDVTALPTQARNVGFVFQNYALFQHMTIADNIEFGLRVRKTTAAERRRRRDELLEMVGLAGLGGRMPRQLSGGQQQRVALARALAHQPDVLLLDEPLGALDAKIRVELRRTLHAVQRELGVTTIMVTHDQEEAFELADRMGVMSFGRLLEVGKPEELYKRPQTEFVATFLGTANLLLGQATDNGVQVGPYHFELDEPRLLAQLDDAHRVQVLFRPEDVVLVDSAKALGCPPLGRGEVVGVTFGGSFERLRVRLPPIPGVRVIAPPVAYGGSSFLVEATRSQDQVDRLPLQVGDCVWVGLHHVHVLTHPGLRFLVLTDKSTGAQSAVAMTSQMARMAHARVMVLGYGLPAPELSSHLQGVKEQLGSGLAGLETSTSTLPVDEATAVEVEREPADLVIIGAGQPNTLSLAEKLLQSGHHHLLLVPPGQGLPQRALVCVARGEPGKEDVLFAGRLLRHLGATATLFTALPVESEPAPAALAATQRYLDNGVQTLALLGVPAQTAVHVGSVVDGILDQLKQQAFDLLVVGAPLPDVDGKIVFGGVINQLLRAVQERSCPVLIVRSSLNSVSPLLANLAEQKWAREVVL
jgi:sulfate/thiosulfate transport system ATP-binding protein